MQLKKIMKKVGFCVYLIGLSWTLFYPSMNGVLMWFSGLVLYFVADIENQKEQAQKVQESL